MSLDTIKNAMPEYAKDIKLNISSLANEDTLSPQQFWGTVVASAMAGRQAFVMENAMNAAREHLSVEAMQAAKAAAAIMAMNNVYYKFAGMMGGEYQTMPAKLRMNIIGNPGVDKMDFELWSLAVSAINGCAYCVKAHEKQLESHGVSKAQIQTAVRVASVIQAASAIMDAVNADVGAPMAQAA